MNKPFLTLIAFLLMVSACITHADTLSYRGDYNALLNKYANPSGVNYKAWAANANDVSKLDDILDAMAAVKVSSLPRQEQVAFYINLYNVAMIKAVFDYYPIKSVTEILPDFGIFKKPYIQQGGRSLSLDDVEKGILFQEYFDPRIHFAVNCASRSCPPLRAEAFTGDALETQLEEQTRIFANSKEAAQVNKKNKSIAYSQLFEWYAKHFDGDNPAQYLNKYRNTPLPTDYQIDWISYDWSLNTSS